MSNEISKSIQRAEENPNENCLAGMQCPKCDSYGPFRILATSTNFCEVHDDGADFEPGDVIWDEESSCTCNNCNFLADVKEFKQSSPENDDEDDDGVEVSMTPLEVVLGKTICAYGKFKLPVGTDLSIDAIKKKALNVEGDVLFDPDWSSGQDLRIVSIESDDGAVNLFDIPLDTTPEEPEGVVKHLDLSTGHLSVKTSEWMSQADPSSSHCTGITVAAYEYGAFFSVPSESETINQLVCPADLKVLLHYARSKGCDVVRVDADGLITDHLPFYDGF